MQPKEKFATQVAAEILAEIRAIAHAEGRQLQALVEEALSVGSLVRLLAFEGGGLSPAGVRLDQLTGEGLSKAALAVKFTGAKGRTLDVVALPTPAAPPRTLSPR